VLSIYDQIKIQRSCLASAVRIGLHVRLRARGDQQPATMLLPSSPAEAAPLARNIMFHKNTFCCCKEIARTTIKLVILLLELCCCEFSLPTFCCLFCPPNGLFRRVVFSIYTEIVYTLSSPPSVLHDLPVCSSCIWLR
jgi:hypothetical protein